MFGPSIYYLLNSTMDTTFTSHQVLKYYRQYEALKALQAKVNDDLKSFKEDCELQEMPFKVFQRVYAAEQKKTRHVQLLSVKSHVNLMLRKCLKKPFLKVMHNFMYFFY